MSMGGAATGHAIDISGALQWNPASISVFDNTSARLDLGLFFSSPEVSSTVPVLDDFGNPTGTFVSGNTKDDRGATVMPALGFVIGNPDSKHTFGGSVFGISGFGVTFPESNSNPIVMPQSMGGFGRMESNYMLLQIGATYAFELTEMLSIGVEPNFNYSALELIPNPTANPGPSGYPVADNASTTGFGAQFGLYFDSGKGITAGLSYKTQVNFDDFEFENTFLDNSTSTNTFDMDYPAIYSIGIGYTQDIIDLAVDYRYIDYENTNGFSTTGWSQTASVTGFGWESISVISAGIQYKGLNNVPLRLGYTFSENPIKSDVVMYNVPATAVIEHAFQAGFGYRISPMINFDLAFHYGTSAGSTSGPMLNPMMVPSYPPYGAVPGSEVSYDMTTSMIMFGVTYSFGN